MGQYRMGICIIHKKQNKNYLFYQLGNYQLPVKFVNKISVVYPSASHKICREEPVLILSNLSQINTL